MNRMNFAYSIQSYLKVIKTNNVAKVRNEAVAIVDFLSECGDQVITLPVFPSLIT